MLSRKEVVNLIEEIRRCENKSEEDIDRLIEKLERGTIDPRVSDYIFWSEMTPEEIVDKALKYKPIEL